MFEMVDDLTSRLRSFNTGFDFRAAGREESVALYDMLVELERLASAAKNLAADRMADTGGWHDHSRSPAHYIAEREATQVNQAAYMLLTLEQMHRFPGS